MKQQYKQQMQRNKEMNAKLEAIGATKKDILVENNLRTILNKGIELGYTKQEIEDYINKYPTLITGSHIITDDMIKEILSWISNKNQ